MMVWWESARKMGYEMNEGRSKWNGLFGMESFGKAQAVWHSFASVGFLLDVHLGKWGCTKAMKRNGMHKVRMGCSHGPFVENSPKENDPETGIWKIDCHFSSCPFNLLWRANVCTFKCFQCKLDVHFCRIISLIQSHHEAAHLSYLPKLDRAPRHGNGKIGCTNKFGEGLVWGLALGWTNQSKMYVKWSYS